MTDKIADAKNFTRGGQIILNYVRMANQIGNRLFLAGLFLFLVLAVPVSYLIVSTAEWVNAGWVIKAHFLNMLHWHNPVSFTWLDGQVYQLLPSDLLTIPNVIALWKSFVLKLLIITLIVMVFSIVIIWLGSRKIRRYGEKYGKEKVISGDTFEPADKVKAKIIKANQASLIKIDSFPLIRDSEVRNFMVHGTQGAGKSQLIRKFLNEIKERGDKAIIYDKGCDLIPSYYKEDSIILNPFDARCANWSLWTECRTMVDYENMANALIPKQGNESDPFWVNAARTILANAAFSDEAKKEQSIIYLLSRLLTSSLESMAELLRGTPAESLVDPKIEKTAISIKSVLATYLKSLCFLEGLKGEPFSIREWIANENDNRWLFISSRDRDHQSIRPLISMWLDIATSNLLSLSRNENRRIWVILDEMASLHKLPYLPATFAEARKFGGCFIIGLQSIAQLQGLYGQKESQAISGQCNTRFFFRSPDSETALWSSRELGEIEIEEPRESYSYGASSYRDGISVGQQRFKRPVISPSDILRQPDLHTYLRLPGDWPITQLSLKYQKPEYIVEGFIERPIDENALQKINKEVRKYEIKPNSTEIKNHEFDSIFS